MPPRPHFVDSRGIREGLKEVIVLFEKERDTQLFLNIPLDKRDLMCYTLRNRLRFVKADFD